MPQNLIRGVYESNERNTKPSRTRDLKYPNDFYLSFLGYGLLEKREIQGKWMKCSRPIPSDGRLYIMLLAYFYYRYMLSSSF